jgi:hypothetical protein
MIRAVSGELARYHLAGRVVLKEGVRILLGICLASGCAVAAPCTQGEGGRPLVEITVKPEARPFLRTANVTEVAIRQLVNTRLATRHIGCIEENAVLPGSEDWVFVAVSASTRQTAPLQIEMSIRNGASVTNQILRWEGLRSVGSERQEIDSAVSALIEGLAAEYDSPEYRKGRREEQ